MTQCKKFGTTRHMANLVKFPSSPLAIQVRRARDARGWTQEEAADAIGISQQAWSKIEDGTTVAPDTWRKIADGLGIDHGDFRDLMLRSKREKKLFVKGGETRLPPAVAAAVNSMLKPIGSTHATNDIETGLWVPLVSWVAAGNLTEVIDWSEFDDVKRIYAPDLDPGGQWIALRVDGSSMNKISPPDSIIFVNLRQKALVPNACYVFTDERGEATYKRYRPDGWESVSYLPQPDVEPEGAITIIGRVRRSMIDM